GRLPLHRAPRSLRLRPPIVTGAEARGRRLFLRTGVAAAVGIAASSVDALTSAKAAQVDRDQDQRETVEAFVRALYDAKDRLYAPKFASYFADPHDYLDPVLGYCALLASSLAVASRYGDGMFKRIAVHGRL